MMTFSVETETLRALASDLAQVEAVLGGLPSLAESYGGQLGSSLVEKALTDFIGNWSQGVSMVTTKATGLQQITSGAANNYDESDASIVRAAGGSQ
jgi:hypothetical protein